MTHTPRAAGLRGQHLRYVALAAGAAFVAVVGCSDSNVPFLTAPTSIPNTQGGIQQAITGLFSFTRTDQFQGVLEMAAFAREGANFTNTEPRFIEYDLGILPTPVGAWIPFWANEYQNIRSAQQITAAVQVAVPAYTAPQRQGLIGVVKTLEALNYLILAWAHDSEGLAITQSPNATALPPAVCLKDALAYVVALLDTANADLDSAGAAPFAFSLPPGFASVGAMAGPSTVAGSFASFNRALAAKAGMELGFATLEPGVGTRRPPVTATAGSAPASPNVAALTRADSAMKASALYLPAALPPNPIGAWAEDKYSVMLDFSAASGDIPNPINSINGTQAVLQEVANVQDTLHDLRWLAKLALNPHAVQQQSYNFVASRWIYGMYPSPSTPLPIIRSETMTLTEAEIRIGLGDYAGAMTLINDVRTEVGGEPPNAAAPTYASAVAALLHELQMSTLWEGGADRVIAIRNFGLEVVDDTTWNGTTFNPDQHTTIDPVDAGEQSGRSGTWTTTCSAGP
jgi:starch-binding outer membrane protein, SusD/RagB family